jgi:hypothetical protein
VFDSGRAETELGGRVVGEAPEVGSELRSLDNRTVRALTGDLLVVEDASGLYRVYGDGYSVDASTGACTCPDAEYRDSDDGCKHYRRVEFHTDEQAVPEWVDGIAVDPLLVYQLEVRLTPNHSQRSRLLRQRRCGGVGQCTPAWRVRSIRVQKGTSGQFVTST